MTTRFIHTADWQLGKNFDRVTNPDKRARLRQERIAVLADIAKIGQEHGTSFVVVAGDLFDSPTADRETVAAALSAIGQIQLPVYVIPGNHDHGGPGCLWEQAFFTSQQPQLAPNLHVLLERQPVQLESAWILPCPLLRRMESEDTTAWIRSEQVRQRCSDGKPVILLAHGSTQSFGYDDEESDSAGINRIELERLPEGLVDYVALGDWHGTKMIHPRAWYSGTPEADRFTKGGDHDPGNILVVEIERGREPKVEKVRTSRLQWHSMEFEFVGERAFEDLKKCLEELLGNRSNEDLLQLDLRGTLGLEEASKSSQLREALEARLLRLKLRDHCTVKPTDAEIQSLAERVQDPLISLVAKQLLAQSDDPVAAVALQELYTVCNS